jgi:hypothetical protein
MSTAMSQATMNGQQLNWGQAPAQSNGKRWGKLAVKLAIGVGAVIAISAGINWAFPGIADTIFGTVGTLGGSILVSASGLTEAAAEMVTHLTGLGEENASSVIDHAKSTLTDLAGELAPSHENFVFAEVWDKLPAALQSNTEAAMNNIQQAMETLSANVGSLTEAQGKALEATIKENGEYIVSNMNAFAARAGDIAPSIAEANAGFVETLQDSFKDVVKGPGLLDLDASHYAMAAGGAGAALLGSQLLGGNRHTSQAATPRVPPAPHPSHIRPNTGKFTAKYHNQDIANHLQANGFAVESAAQQPQHRTI